MNSDSIDIPEYTKIKYNVGDFTRYLKRFLILKNSNYTHTSFANPAGAFYIQTDQYPEFLWLYSQAIKNGEELHITEKHRMVSPILLDFDFKYHIDVNSLNDNMELNRRYTNKDIRRLMKIYIKEMSQYLDIDPKLIEDKIQVYVLEKTEPKLLKKETINDNEMYLLKDGLHVMIPDICTKPTVQHIIREKCLEKMNEHFKKMGMIDSAEKIFDQDVIEKNPWLMYGSCKPNKEPYLLTYILTYESLQTNEDGSINWTLNKTNDGSINLPPTDILISQLSIRNKIHEIKISDSYREEVEQIEEDQTEKERIKLTNRQILKKTRNTNKNICKDIEIVRKLINILSPNRTESHEGRMRVGWCLHNIDHGLLEDWTIFCTQSSHPKYNDIDTARLACQEKWEYMKDGCLGIGTLRMWAKQDDPLKFEEIIKNDLSNLIFKAKTATDTDISMVIFQKYKYDFVCSNIKKSIWWEFREHRWVPCDAGHSLRKNMSTHIFKIMNQACADYASKAAETDDEEEQDRYSNYSKKYNKIALSLKKDAAKSALLRECSELFYQEKFEDKLDCYPNLIGFKNGVYDLETMEFRDGHPDDYISFSTHTNYIEYDEALPIYSEIKTFMSQIMPDKEMSEYLTNLLSSFLSGEIKDQKFYVMTGNGGNGKSKLTELYQNSFGDYCGEFNVSMLTRKRVSSNETNSELAMSKGKRFIILQEPSENEKLEIGLMKELTGGDKIICRGLFKDPMEFRPQFHLALACNHLPIINSDDGGTWRRIRVLHYPSKFCDNPDPNNPFEFLIDPDLNRKFAEWKEYFISFLINNYKINCQTPIYEPKQVTDCTKEYQRENDLLKLYMDERMSPTDEEGAFVSLSEVYNDFKFWFKETGESRACPKKLGFGKYIQNVLKQKQNKTIIKGWSGFTLNSYSEYNHASNKGDSRDIDTSMYKGNKTKSLFKLDKMDISGDVI
jgi:P4 family phage/plasmid primase-like protien